MKNLTLEVGGDADRFASEYLYERFRRAFDKRVAQGASISDEGPKRRLAFLIQGICSSGAPYNRRSDWSCIVCSTKSASLSRT